MEAKNDHMPNPIEKKGKKGKRKEITCLPKNRNFVSRTKNLKTKFRTACNL